MKLEVGMYAFSKKCRDYGIGKIVNIVEGGLGFKGDLIDIQYVHSKHAIENHDVIASFNIIDLIKVGDYVNGFYIDQLPQNPEYKLIWHLSTYGDDDEAFKEEDIKSIVTKEQFEKMSYGLEN